MGGGGWWCGGGCADRGVKCAWGGGPVCFCGFSKRVLKVEQRWEEKISRGGGGVSVWGIGVLGEWRHVRWGVGRGSRMCR